MARIGANERGLVDVLVASQGRTFTGTWFSTLSTHVQAHPRLRRPPGRVDLLLRTETMGRLPKVGGAAAAVVCVSIRRPGRDVDGRAAPAPRARGVYNIVQDPSVGRREATRGGYPQDAGTARSGPPGPHRPD